jgi:hypothetical protein
MLTMLLPLVFGRYNINRRYRWEDDMLGKAILAITFVAAAIPGIALANSAGRWFAATVPANGLVFVQAAVPKTEAILRKAIQDLQDGKPDFDSMEPGLQQAVKEQSANTADIYRHLGSLQTLKYIGTRDGADMYRAVYQNAAATYTIQLSSSGKISVLLLQPAFPWE